MNRPIASYLLPVLVALLARPAPAADLRLTPILRARVASPGIGPAGAVIEEFTDPRLNDRGDLAFLVTTRDPRTGEASRTAVVGRPGALATLLAPGAPAPGLRGATATAAAGIYGLDPAGNVLLAARVSGPDLAYDSGAYYVGRPGALLPVALPGRKIPGTNLAARAGAVGLLADGRAVVHAQYPGGLHVFLADAKKNAFTRLATPGQPLPGSGEAAVFRSFADRPTSNARGEFLFVATFDPPPGTAVDNDLPPAQSLWFGTPDRLTRVLQAGDPVPGLPGKRVRRFIHPMVLGDGGHVVVGVSFEGDDLGAALLTGKPGEPLALVATSGTPAPGLPVPATPASAPATPRLPHVGQLTPDRPAPAPSALTLHVGGFVAIDPVGRLFWHTSASRPTQGVTERVEGAWLYHDGKLSLLGTNKKDDRAEPATPVAGLPPGETCTLRSLPSGLTPTGQWLGIARLGGDLPGGKTGPALVHYHPDAGFTLLAGPRHPVPLPGGKRTTTGRFSWVGPPNAANQFLAIATLDDQPGDVLLLGQLAAPANAKPKP